VYKKAASILMYGVILSLVIGFHPQREKPQGGDEPLKNSGNTPCNILNTGFAAMDDNWVYFSDDTGLFKMKKDNTQKVKVCDDRATYLNVSGDYIYFNSYDKGEIFRAKTDGTGREKISDDDGSYISISGDSIYYINRDFRNENLVRGLYSMDIDGNNKKILDRGIVSSAAVMGRWIYYLKDNRLFRIKDDGTGKNLVSSDHIMDMGIYDGWIYYNTYSLGRDLSLCKIKPDGSGKTKIASNIGNFNIYGGWIYYSLTFSNSQSWAFYKMKTDGTENTRLVDVAPSNISILDDFIYYYDNQDKKFYRIKTDGTGKEKM